VPVVRYIATCILPTAHSAGAAVFLWDAIEIEKTFEQACVYARVWSVNLSTDLQNHPTITWSPSYFAEA
jgi:hypothetical protein